jgi:hypothetical protein
MIYRFDEVEALQNCNFSQGRKDKPPLINTASAIGVGLKNQPRGFTFFIKRIEITAKAISRAAFIEFFLQQNPGLY